MTPQELERMIQRKASEIRAYANTKFPAQAGNEALRFINSNFRAQSWQGQTTDKWQANQRKGTILAKTGHLRASIYYTAQPGMATIKSHMPYAAIHNEGGTVITPVTPKMRKFFWAMYYKEGGRNIRTSAAGGQYQSLNSGIDQRAKKWRAMALTKKTSFTVKIPQRQFAPTLRSTSPVLDRAIEAQVADALRPIFTA